jgi:hypothetical protein
MWVVKQYNGLALALVKRDSGGTGPFQMISKENAF